MTFRFLSILIVSLLAACAPRGETKTLDEVLALAKARFSSASSAHVSEDVSLTLKSVADSLSKMSSSESSEVNSQVQNISQSLAALVGKSSYTARPAMGELLAQYRNFGSNSQINAGQLKLLAARTYSVLASELETTGFAVK